MDDKDLIKPQVSLYGRRTSWGKLEVLFRIRMSACRRVYGTPESLLRKFLSVVSRRRYTILTDWLPGRSLQRRV